MKKNELVFEVYSMADLEKNVFPYLPLHYRDMYDVRVDTYGYVHDTGVNVHFIPAKVYGETVGWDTLAEDLRKLAEKIRKIWEINNKYGYH